MTTSFARKEPGLGIGLSVSTILHLALFALLTLTHFSLQSIPPEQVYYVDVVNLPVADPRQGSPAATAKEAPSPAPPPAPSAASRPMTMPVPAAKPAGGKKHPVTPAAPAEPAAASGSEFEDRLKMLEREADERRQAAVLDRLRTKVAVNTAASAGMPHGTGTEAGSDYASYIQSRLYDAFKVPKALPGKSPEVLIHLTINRNGRVAEYRIERSSGDKAFEDAVARAVANAERAFRPPPNNGTFNHKFVFKPDSVGKK